MDFELENGGGGGSVFVLKKTQKTPFFIHFRSSLALYSTPCADCRLQIFGENVGKIDFRGEGMGKF